MSCGIIRIEKYSGTTPKGIQIHDQRKLGYSHSNKDIDFDRSRDNYDLHNSEPINYTNRIKERIKELNLPRAVRKDAVTMVQCMITSDKGFFDRLPAGKQEEFFQKSYDWVKERYGAENIISATVHLDERTPHIHINFVPATADGRLCAKDLFKSKDLFKLQDDFYKDICKEFGLVRGERKEERRKHLSTEEFKIATKREELKAQMGTIYQAEHELEQKELALQQEKEKLEEKQNAFRSDLKAARETQESVQAINTIQGNKTLLGGKITLSERDFNTLKDNAKLGATLPALEHDFKIVKQENQQLRESYSKMSGKLDKYGQEIKKLQGENTKLKNIINSASDFLQGENLLDKFIKTMKDEQEQEAKQTKMKQQVHKGIRR